MKHNVADLEGARLDRAVGLAMGYELDADGDNRTIRENGGAPSAWNPSTDWSQGGPIIERERIDLTALSDCWEAWDVGQRFIYGETPLVAAMRAFVARKFGTCVELP